MMNSLLKLNTTLSMVVAAMLMMLAAAPAYSFDGELQGEVQDAWLTGKAETVLALNEHLNVYSIAVRVRNAEVRLSGDVASELDKALAEELVIGISGIESVRNELQVKNDLLGKITSEQLKSRRSFARWIDDLTTTAVIRSKYLTNREVGGLDINVQTRDDVVTLSGVVDSAAESALAEQIAMNTGDVVQVENRILVTTGTEVSNR
jgi:osmotically-inducible protein OsmY